ncbi:multiprotein-bridging factor 1 family protein [Streptomyces sp. NPDC059874]|uniref:helix-turn-helix domain-containing protein n=1 Tax=Streptomyces sp. NPDC059874 TaxID=3346983 RepID=UPI0036582BD5
MDIGELILELRGAQGWSQARLADEINRAEGTTLTREYVARWERGKCAPRGFYLAALSRVLDVPLSVAVPQDPALQQPAVSVLPAYPVPDCSRERTQKAVANTYPSGRQQVGAGHDDGIPDLGG